MWRVQGDPWSVRVDEPSERRVDQTVTQVCRPSLRTFIVARLLFTLSEFSSYFRQRDPHGRLVSELWISRCVRVSSPAAWPQNSCRVCCGPNKHAYAYTVVPVVLDCAKISDTWENVHGSGVHASCSEDGYMRDSCRASRRTMSG
jgi:hypothetical protein